MKATSPKPPKSYTLLTLSLAQNAECGPLGGIHPRASGWAVKPEVEAPSAKPAQFLRAHRRIFISK